MICVSVVTFAVSDLIPADPARYAAGVEASAAEVQQLRHQLGLDRPLYIQYLRYVEGLAHGDLGFSIATRRPVLRDLVAYFPPTLELVLVSLGLMIVIGVPAGVISAVSRGNIFDVLTRVPTIIGTGVPIFWLGLLGQFFFYYKWGLLPGSGQMPPGLGQMPHVTGLLTVDTLITGDVHSFVQAIRYLIMPAAVLAIGRVAIITRLTRASILEILGQDFIRTARAKGLGASVVLFKHALRPALIPILTETGSQFGWLLGGTVLVESIFAWPGVGQYAFNGIQFLDLPAIMGVTLLLTLFKVVANLLVDMLYVVVDPRVVY